MEYAAWFDDGNPRIVYLQKCSCQVAGLNQKKHGILFCVGHLDSYHNN